MSSVVILGLSVQRILAKVVWKTCFLNLWKAVSDEYLFAATWEHEQDCQLKVNMVPLGMGKNPNKMTALWCISNLTKVLKVWKNLKRSERIWENLTNWKKLISEILRNFQITSWSDTQKRAFLISDQQFLRLSDCQTIRLSDHQTTSYSQNIRLSDCQTARLSDVRPSDSQLFSDHQSFSEHQVPRPPDCQTARCQTIR